MNTNDKQATGEGNAPRTWAEVTDFSKVPLAKTETAQFNACPACDGRGRRLDAPSGTCAKCSGTGKVFVVTGEGEVSRVSPTAGEMDFDAHYAVKGYRGIAWYLIGYVTERLPIECEEYIDWTETQEQEDTSRVVAVMVGDDRKFTFDVEDVEVIDEDDFCHSCGQIGCTHDGRERE